MNSAASACFLLTLVVASSAAVSADMVRDKRIMKELRAIQGANSFRVETVDGDINQWYVYINATDEDSELYKSLKQVKSRGGQEHVKLHVLFPDGYPFEPPLVRVIYPKIYGAFVQPGGGFCLKLLTGSGWSSAFNMESVIVSIALSMNSGTATRNGNTDRKELDSEYNLERAKKDTVSVSESHGWGRRRKYKDRASRTSS